MPTRDEAERLHTPVVASAPGKVMIAGEYAVLDGARAIVAAVDRRAVATIGVEPATTTAPPSEFLVAARELLVRERGALAALAFDRLAVDTAALHEGERKLGLGSSAAATVAAIAATLAAIDPRAPGQLDHTRVSVARLAAEAHATAQEGRGARGSGADIAAATAGGVIAYRMAVDDARGSTRKVVLPADLVLAFAWTAQPADTATLVRAVAAAREAQPAAVEVALAAIAAAADALVAATTAAHAIAAIAAGGDAMTRLADATGAPLVPSSVGALAARLAPLGGTAKTTGAGGGDVVVIALPAQVDRDDVERAIIESGLWPLSCTLDPTGVDFRQPAA